MSEMRLSIRWLLSDSTDAGCWRQCAPKVGFHAVHNGWSLSHRVWLGWEDGASSPQAAAVPIPNDIASVVKWIRMFFFYLHPSFLELFSICKYRTYPLSSPVKELSPESLLKSLTKTYRSAALVSLSMFAAKLKGMKGWYSKSCTLLTYRLLFDRKPKPKSKGLSLDIWVWYETSLCVKSILWQSFLGMVLRGKTKQDGVWIEPCVFGQSRGSHSWLETCTCSAQGCASAHVCVFMGTIIKSSSQWGSCVMCITRNCSLQQ